MSSITVEEALRSTALDYIEGWHTGDAERMERALHPDLAKRIQRNGADGVLSHMTAMQLIERTAEGVGRKETMPPTKVEILGVYGRSASVRVDVPAWVDWLHLIETEDGWKIVNVLWELKPDNGTA